MAPAEIVSDAVKSLLKLLRSLLILVHGKLRPVIASPGTYFDWAWDVSRRSFFSVILVAVILAKLFHVYAYFTYLTFFRFLVWCPTFFVQDAVIILLTYGLTRPFRSRPCRVGSAVVIIPFR